VRGLVYAREKQLCGSHIINDPKGGQSEGGIATENSERHNRPEEIDDFCLTK
jgi:hypothetical protein